MALATPRILPSHLHAFAPASHPTTSTVRMLGNVTSMHGDQATLTSGDGSTVTLVLNRDSHISLQNLYEVVGKVINLEGGAGLGLRVLSATQWPKNGSGQPADLKVFEAVVDATHRYKEIFYGDGNDDNAGGY